MPEIVNIFFNSNQKSLSICNTVRDKLEERGYTVAYDANPRACMNLCIGGDGAFLRAVHDSRFSSIPFVGINTGHLGFYQEILIPNIDTFIQDFSEGHYHIESLDLIEAHIINRDTGEIHKHKALNEFVIKDDDNTIIYIDVFIDGNHLESFGGDALLVSTPSGSTAYNFSAGGAVLYQSLEGYQLTPLAPINSKAYRSLLNPLVIPKKSVLSMDILNRENKKSFLVIVDGVAKNYQNCDLKFIVSDTKIHKLVFDKNWYWINIKDKFL